MNELISQHLDVWTSAIARKSSAGRGNKSPSPAGEGNPTNTRNAKYTAYGIKKLRELILELAVRGKLVPQDPNDESANILLNKIAEKKAFLTANGELKNQPTLAKISKEDLPFILPKNWQWTRLGDVTNYGITDKLEPNEVDDFIWVLELEDIEKETSRLLQKVRYAERNFQSSKNRFSENDVLYGKLRPYLDKVIIADEDGVCTTEIIPIRAFDCITPRYLQLVLKSPYFINYANDSTHGMNLPRLGTERARLALFPLAPESEQHRIVVKVDELMTLCDQLEQQQSDQLAAHQTLVKTLLDTLTQAADATEFEHAWSRIANHFDTLFITESSIDQLNQILLQLAVMGKLVPQDQNDQAADILLKRGKDKEKNAQSLLLPIIPPEQQIFTLPPGWCWTRGEIVADFIDPHPSHRTPPEYENGVPYIGYTDIDHKNGINFSNARRVNPTIFNEHQERYILKNGDFVFGKIGTLGKPFFLPKPFNYCLSANLILIQPNLMVVNPKYLAMYLDSPVFITVMADNTTNSTHGVFGIKKARLICVPLPPIQEQHRIVAKVNELMAMCGALKARIAAAQTTQLQLADAIVEQAVV